VLKAFPESAAQAATTGSLGDMPLAVLSHDPEVPEPDYPSRSGQAHERRLATHAGRVSSSLHQKHADDCQEQSHYIQLDRPDLVIEAIRKVVDQARQADPR
jgi:hypothetical protein